MLPWTGLSTSDDDGCPALGVLASPAPELATLDAWTLSILLQAGAPPDRPAPVLTLVSRVAWSLLLDAGGAFTFLV